MAFIKWQCTKCGKQVDISSFGTPSVSQCPSGGNHVWSKMGRFVQRLLEWL